MLRSATARRFLESVTAGVFRSTGDGLESPAQLPGLATWYDVSDVNSMRNAAGAVPASGEAVALVSDKSGNSAVNVYASNTAASNNVTSPNKTVTGNQTITLDLMMEDFTPAADRTVIDKLSGNNGFQVLVLTTGVVRLRVGDGAAVTNVDSTAANTLTNVTRGTLGIVWTDGVGASFTQNGGALGVPVAAVKTLTNAAVVCTIGNFAGVFWRVQVGSVYDCNPALSGKIVANGGTLSSGGDTWTLVSAGATGARISGARDLYQGTAANQPIYHGPRAASALLNSSAFVNASGVDAYDTFSGASATAFTAVKTGTTNEGVACSQPAFTVVLGQAYEVSCVLTLNSGSAPTVALNYDAATQFTKSTSATLAAGSNTVTIYAIDSGSFVLAFRNAAAETSNYSISGISVTVKAVTGGYLYCDGSNDYLKSPAFALAQPVSIYGVLNQLTWTINDILLDGNANGSMQLYQSVTTPSLQQYSGGGGAASSGLALNTNGVVTSIVNGAASFLRINRAAAATGNPGAGTPNGFTLGAAGNGASPANTTARSVLVYAAAHSQSVQDRVILWLGRMFRIAV